MPLDAGGDVVCKDSFGDTPLDMCRKCNRYAFTAQLPLNHGAVEPHGDALIEPRQDDAVEEAIKAKESEKARRNKNAEVDVPGGHRKTTRARIARPKRVTRMTRQHRSKTSGVSNLFAAMRNAQLIRV